MPRVLRSRPAPVARPLGWPKSPLWAALLSLVLCGAGHAYLGRWPMALLLLSLWAITGIVVPSALGWVPFFGIWALAVVDAYRGALAHNARLRAYP